MNYRIAFADADWEPMLNGTARLKRVRRPGKVLRLVEMTPSSEHPAWCETGHVGMIVEGEFEIDFDSAVSIFSAGDALFIPGGAAHRHRPRALSSRARMFLIEDETA